MLKCINCAAPIVSRLYCKDCFSVLGTPDPQPSIPWPPVESITEAPEPKRLAFKVPPRSYPLAMKFKRTQYGYSGKLLGQVNDSHSIYRSRK